MCSLCIILYRYIRHVHKEWCTKKMGPNNSSTCCRIVDVEWIGLHYNQIICEILRQLFGIPGQLHDVG